jgi:2-oxoglutarate ferredoxin oxidoreductase subunit beta
VNKGIYEKYLRKGKLPHMWCPGCGIGIVLGSLIRVLEKLHFRKEDTVLVSGIGCSGRISGYLDMNTLHTTHGRPLAFATGIKLAKPTLNVIVAAGDGDTLAIGGNHFIHACRRNIDITLIIFNNWIYGMTGGQIAPTTPEGSKATTAPFGSIEPDFNISRLAIEAGATFVARGTSFHIFELDKLIEEALNHKGFSVVEVLSPCPINYGRRNALSTRDMYEWLKDNTVPLKTWESLREEDRAGKIPRGVLHHIKERKEYIERLTPVSKDGR